MLQLITHWSYRVLDKEERTNKEFELFILSDVSDTSDILMQKTKHEPLFILIEDTKS